MSDETSGVADDAESASADGVLSTGEYVRLTVFNRVSLLGITLAVVGATVVALTSPTGPFPADGPLVGGGLLLVGVFCFAVGFTLGQRALGRREDW